MQCEDCGARLWKAGERVPPGRYLRIDDGSNHLVEVGDGERLPPTFDGHIGLYRPAGCRCPGTCYSRHATDNRAAGGDHAPEP